MVLKHAVVTGGAGFIGSHLVRKLLSENVRVTVVDDLSTGRRSNLPSDKRLRFVRKSVQDCGSRDFTSRVDAVAHLAGHPSVQYSWDRPHDAHDNNLSATLHMAALCRDMGVKRFVFASSAAVYGDVKRVPVREADASEPLAPYGFQKWASERYLQYYAVPFSLEIVALRLFNVFGPLQDPKSPYSGVISLFSDAMKSGRPVTLFGDGRQTRDFVYVEDTARAFAQALRAPVKRPFTVCNVASGRPTTLLDLIRELSALHPAWKAGVRKKAARKGDIRHSVADVSRAKKELGFRSRESVRSGLQKMARHV